MRKNITFVIFIRGRELDSVLALETPEGFCYRQENSPNPSYKIKLFLRIEFLKMSSVILSY